MATARPPCCGLPCSFSASSSSSSSSTPPAVSSFPIRRSSSSSSNPNSLAVTNLRLPASLPSARLSRLHSAAPGRLFIDEAIGAEYGEGFETFRMDGPLKVDVDYLNDRLQECFLQRIRHAMKPDEAFGLIFSWDNVVERIYQPMCIFKKSFSKEVLTM